MKKNNPKIEINTNKVLDKELIIFFAKLKDPYIFNKFSVLNKVKNSDYDKFIPELVEKNYQRNHQKIVEQVDYFKNNIDKIKNMCQSLARITNTDWSGIEKVIIYSTICPIGIRLLDKGIVTVPIQKKKSLLLYYCIHEIIHLIYFKAWKEIFPQDKKEDFEAPSKIWVLSEILDPVIMNDEELQKIVKAKGELYPHWQNVKINSINLVDVFSKIYKNSKDFKDFLITSRKKFEMIEKQHNLINKLISSNK